MTPPTARNKVPFASEYLAQKVDCDSVWQAAEITLEVQNSLAAFPEADKAKRDATLHT
jgi:hypothetical protein